MTAANDSAFRAKQVVRPTAATSAPPTAEPSTRARLTDTEFRVTALVSCSRGTSSAMRLCRAGLSKTVSAPSSRDSTTTVPTLIARSAVSRANRTAMTAEAAWVTYSTRRLS